jgi:hypothetical protein
VRAIIGGIEQHRLPRESASWRTAAATFGGDGGDSISGDVGRCAVGDSGVTLRGWHRRAGKVRGGVDGGGV